MPNTFNNSVNPLRNRRIDLEKELHSIDGKDPKELEDMVRMAELLATIGNKIVPEKVLLAKIISAIDIKNNASIIEGEETRYTHTRGDVKGRASLATFSRKLEHLIMSWKLIVPAVLVVAVAFVLYSRFSLGPSREYVPPAETLGLQGTAPEGAKQSASFPKATGDVNTAVNAMIKGSSDEVLALQDESNDVALIRADSETVVEFAQSYNENEL